MKRSMVTLVTFLAVTTSRAADLATTLHFSPSLNREANPFVAVLGFDWSLLLLSNVLGLVVFIFVPLAAYWRWPSKTVTHRPATTWEFASLCLYDRPMKRAELIKSLIRGWPLPKDWRQMLRLFGFSVSWTVAAGSWMAVFSWWATNAWGWSAYRAFRNSLGIGRYPLLELLAGLTVCIIATARFFKSECSHANIAEHRIDNPDGLSNGEG